MIPIVMSLLTNRFVLIGIAIAALLGMGWIWHAGEVREAVSQERHQWEERIAVMHQAREAELAQWEVQVNTLNQIIETKTTEKIVEVRTVTKEVIREIPKYIPSTIDVNLGFVYVHNAAAKGTSLPSSPSGPVDTPSGIGLPRVAETIANNYAECRTWREQVIGWQRWHEEVRTGWEVDK